MLRARVAAAIAALLLIAASGVGGEPPDLRDAIARAVAGEPALDELYRPVGYRPLWTADGVPGRSANAAVELLEDARADGLDPAGYDAARLRGLFEALSRARGSAADDVVRFEHDLTAQVLRYARDLYHGRIDPRDLGVNYGPPAGDDALIASVREGAISGRVVQAVRSWAPRGPEYAALAAALRRYRDLAVRDTGLPLPLPSTSVHPGERYPAASALHERLVLLGDLAPDAPPPVDTRLDGPLVDGLRHFQIRHGLEPDGILGRQTAAQLDVPLAWRVRQLELAMERLRWLPRQTGERLVLVNVPMFRLFAWDSVPPGGPPAFSTRVIVGRAGRTQTPLFGARMTEIIFRPYWNVPSSIVRNEILPMLARRPDYLQREQLELVSGETDSSPVVPATPENLARLRSGALRLRQRPGPKNALGRIKFSFPNAYDVYMHATPAPALFARARRDFSHGCVRVQDPVGLAAWLLRDRPGWDRERISAAMDAPASSRVAMEEPVHVLLVYSTAAVLLDSNDVAFAEDIYHRDEPLDQALRGPMAGSARGAP
jgi:murein L,D-transpeptidase YcbB/YkuD